jgi:hypothetical protein
MTSLDLVEGTFTWSWLQDAAEQLPRLERLAIIQSQRQTEKDEGWSQTPEQLIRFLELKKRIKHLKFDLKDIKSLNFYLKQFTCSDSTLMSLEIGLNNESPPYRIGIDFLLHLKKYNGLVEVLYDFFKSCSGTLKSFKIHIDEVSAMGVLPFFGALMERPLPLYLDTLHLEVFEKYCSKTEVQDQKLSDLRLADLIHFLVTQPQLKSLRIPVLQSTMGLTVQAMPRNIQEIGFSHEPNMDLYVWERLHQTKSVIIIGLGSTPFAFKFKNRTCVPYPELESFKYSGKPNVGIMNTITDYFPNLTKLDVACSPNHISIHPFNNLDLQLIPLKLSHLKVLSLKNFVGITDFGLTGIKKEDAEMLMATRSLYLKQESEVFSVQRDGVSLSSLKGVTFAHYIIVVSAFVGTLRVRTWYGTYTLVPVQIRLGSLFLL